MATQVFNVTAFKAQFPEFAATDPTALQGYWDMGTAYLNPNDGWLMSGATLLLALNLMTAHMARIFTMIGAGQDAGVTTSASEGSVSVSLQPPPAKTAFQQWLSSTPYGLQLRALLNAKSAGGFYVAGLPELAAFRKVGGVF